MTPTSSNAEGGSPLFVSVDGEAPMDWETFCVLNDDAFTSNELDAIRRDLERDGSYQAGGGAAADVLITIALPAAAECEPA